MNEYYSTNHCKYSIKYHLVWCPKFRFEVLNGEIVISLKDIITNICNRYNYKILELEVMPDHLYIFASTNPTVVLTDIVRTTKSISVIKLFKEYPKLKSFYSHYVFCGAVEKIKNPKHLSKYENKLTRLQRRLARKEEGSNNWQKLKHKIAKVHEKIKNSKLAKHIADVSWGKLIDRLEYKGDWYNCIIQKVDIFFTSSQTCSECGAKNSNVKDLSVRNWTCECGAEYDCDLNASLNILQEEKKLLAG